MAATTYNLADHESGDTYLGVEFSLSNQDGAIDLTNAVIELTTDRGEGLITTDEGGITITDAAGGVFEIDEQVIDWEAGTYLYEIQVTFPGNRKRTYVKGEWQIL